MKEWMNVPGVSSNSIEEWINDCSWCYSIEEWMNVMYVPGVSSNSIEEWMNVCSWC